MQYAADGGPAERGRADGDVPERLVDRGRLRLILEEIGYAWVWREPKHVLRSVGEGRRPEELRKFGVERGEDIEK